MLRTIQVKAIASMAENRVIGRGNELVFRDREDMKRFSELTTGHTVVMGRKTFESLPVKYRPLPERLNVVLSRAVDFSPAANEVLVISDLDHFLNACELGNQELPSDVIWIIGGAQVYRLALPWCNEIFLTQVHQQLEGDAFFPEFEHDYALEDEEARAGFSFRRFVRQNHSEKSTSLQMNG